MFRLVIMPPGSGPTGVLASPEFESPYDRPRRSVSFVATSSVRSTLSDDYHLATFAEY
jgi:hypothetical protein